MEGNQGRSLESDIMFGGQRGSALPEKWSQRKMCHCSETMWHHKVAVVRTDLEWLPHIVRHLILLLHSRKQFLLDERIHISLWEDATSSQHSSRQWKDGSERTAVKGRQWRRRCILWVSAQSLILCNISGPPEATASDCISAQVEGEGDD